jgi:Domain of unknown function (DUF6438)
MVRSLLCTAALAACLSACAPSPPASAPTAPGLASAPHAAPGASIRLAESLCYFTCASYEIEVKPGGDYTLTNIKNTRKDGVSTGSFGPDVWSKTQAAFDAASFATMATDLTPSAPMRPGGVPCMNDLPAATFKRHIAEGNEKQVVYNTGCDVPEARELLTTLRTLFQWSTLVKPD